MNITFSQLIQRRTFDEIVNIGLEIAQAVGLPVTSWRVGDPTRSLYSFQARVLDLLENVASLTARSAFLRTSTDDWATIIAAEVYGVERVEARASTPTVTIDNTQGAVYEIGVGEIRFRSIATNATFTNTSPVSIGSLESGITIQLTAETPGLAGTVNVNDIDDIITTYLGLEIVSSTASTGADRQSLESLITQCRASLSQLSPFGPSDIYEFVARDPALTGVSDVNRASSTNDSTTGDVNVYVASVSGPVSIDSLAAVEQALLKYATAPTATPHALQSEAVPINVTASLTPPQEGASEIFANRYEAILNETAHASLISRSKIIAMLHETFPDVTTLTLTVPAADIQLEEQQVPTIGDVSIG